MNKGKKIDRQATNLKEQFQERGYIYLVKFGEIYKIGKAFNAKKRMADILVSNPFAQLFMTIEMFGYGLAEVKLHNVFASKKISGEWFKMTNSDIEEIVEIIKDCGKIIRVSHYPVQFRNHTFQEQLKILEGNCESLKEENKLLRQIVDELQKIIFNQNGKETKN